MFSSIIIQFEVNLATVLDIGYQVFDMIHHSVIANVELGLYITLYVCKLISYLNSDLFRMMRPTLTAGTYLVPTYLLI